MESDEEAPESPPNLSSLPPEILIMIFGRPELSLEDLYYSRRVCRSLAPIASEALVAKIKETLVAEKNWKVVVSFVTNIRKAFVPGPRDFTRWKPLSPKVLGTLLRLAGVSDSVNELITKVGGAYRNEYCLVAFKASLGKGMKLSLADVFSDASDGLLSFKSLGCWSSDISSCCNGQLQPWWLTRSVRRRRRLHQPYEQLAMLAANWWANKVEDMVQFVVSQNRFPAEDRWLAVSLVEDWFHFYREDMVDAGYDYKQDAEDAQDAPSEDDLDWFVDEIWPRMLDCARREQKKTGALSSTKTAATGPIGSDNYIALTEILSMLKLSYVATGLVSISVPDVEKAARLFDMLSNPEQPPIGLLAGFVDGLNEISIPDRFRASKETSEAFFNALEKTEYFMPTLAYMTYRNAWPRYMDQDKPVGNP